MQLNYLSLDNIIVIIMYLLHFSKVHRYTAGVVQNNVSKIPCILYYIHDYTAQRFIFNLNYN